MVNAIHWFREDLRLHDNPSLFSACQRPNVLCVYILDPKEVQGSASRVWLHHALNALNERLDQRLSMYHGDPKAILMQLMDANPEASLSWNRLYTPYARERDASIKDALRAKGHTVTSHPGNLLWEPWQILKADQTPYKVFTPFYKNGCLTQNAPRAVIGTPQTKGIQKAPDGLSLDALQLLPEKDWHRSMMQHWQAGEQHALKTRDTFLREKLHGYKEGRNIPHEAWVSRLSPHLHFGELSVHDLWQQTLLYEESEGQTCFLSELAWREFAYNQLFFNPDMMQKNLQTKFERFPWQWDEKVFSAWQKGQTGIPMVDAGMRELWQTGYMHNRLRMITASFLVKNLMIHWKKGMAWFEDCLLDADLASNTASWQWVAGCGYDAAPYFRIFNPVTQGTRFDPEGHYIRSFLPELKQLPNRYLHAPWEAPKEVLDQAHLQLGQDYPYPIVDLKISRKKALDAFKSI